MDDIQAELHLRNLDYVPEQLLEIYNRTSGEFDYLADVETNDYTLQIELSEDESRAYVNIIPPSEEGDPLTMIFFRVSAAKILKILLQIKFIMNLH